MPNLQSRKLVAGAIVTALAVLVAVALRCGSSPVLGGPIRHAALSDGQYVGNAQNINKAEVRVTIAGQRLTEVTILSLDSTPYGDRAGGPIARRIVEEQSTDVDVVAGATEASHVIMNAAEDALRKSYDTQ